MPHLGARRAEAVSSSVGAAKSTTLCGISSSEDRAAKDPPSETSKKQSKGKPGVQESKFFNKNLHFRSSSSIFIKLFAFLNVSGLSECFVFRGFFAKKTIVVFLFQLRVK